MSEQRVFVFRLNDHGQGPELVRQVLLERGWVEHEEDERDEYDWNLWWRTSRFRNSDYEMLLPWQRVNHYPKTTGITKKDSLARNLKRMRGVYGPSVFNFAPLAFNLPNDYTKFVAEYTKLREKEGKQVFWICKPADLSRGRGIFVFRELSELQYDCNAVVQRYISNPMLISGYKFDLRIYVAVPSFHPLHIYVYQEGIVRFSTEKFDLSVLKNLYAHLTNTSINKYSPSYSHEKERVGPGCKWTITQFRHYLHQNHIDDSLLWTRICHIILLTITMQAPQVPKVTQCLELYGFDIIIDEKLKPWLLEVNFSPALSSDCQTDIVVKKPMLHDLVDMMNFRDEDIDRAGKTSYRERQMGKAYGVLPSGRSRSRLGKPLRNNSLHKLPDISRDPGSSGSASRSNTGLDLDEAAPVPLVPGCGLPSVQQEDSQPNSRSEQGATSKLESPPRTKQIPSNLSMSSSLRRTDSSSSSLSGGRFAKKHSKASVGSDSGYSGSSDSSDMVSLSDETVQRHRVSGLRRPVPGRRKSHVVPPLNGGVTETAYVLPVFRSQVKDSNPLPPMYYATGISNLGSVGAEHSNESDTEESESRDDPTSANKAVTSPRVVSRAESRVSRTYGRDSVLGKRKPVSVSYPANPLAGRSPTHRRGSLGHVGGMARHGATYLQPWKTRSSFADTRAPARAPQQRFGGYCLVFPFNETTRRAAANNLDTRVVIRECQKVIKARLAEKHDKGGDNDKSGKKAVSHNYPKGSPRTKEKVMDVEPVWGPLKVPTETAIQQ